MADQQAPIYFACATCAATCSSTEKFCGGCGNAITPPLTGYPYPPPQQPQPFSAVDSSRNVPAGVYPGNSQIPIPSAHAIPPQNLHFQNGPEVVLPVQRVVLVRRPLVIPPETMDEYGYPEPTPGVWRTSASDCCQSMFPNCLMAWFLPCVSFAQINARLGTSMGFAKSLILSFAVYAIFSAGVVLWAMKDCTYYEDYYYAYYHCNYETINYIGLFAYWFGIFAGAYLYTKQRCNVRYYLNLPGDSCSDSLYSVFCSPCSLAQLATQVGSYRKGHCSITPPPVAVPAGGTPQPEFTATAAFAQVH